MRKVAARVAAIAGLAIVLMQPARGEAADVPPEDTPPSNGVIRVSVPSSDRTQTVEIPEFLSQDCVESAVVDDGHSIDDADIQQTIRSLCTISGEVTVDPGQVDTSADLAGYTSKSWSHKFHHPEFGVHQSGTFRYNGSTLQALTHNCVVDYEIGAKILSDSTHPRRCGGNGLNGSPPTQIREYFTFYLADPTGVVKVWCRTYAYLGRTGNITFEYVA